MPAHDRRGPADEPGHGPDQGDDHDGYDEAYGRSEAYGRAGGHHAPGPAARTPSGNQGGIPDGLLVGILVFLLGMTLLVWSATGLAGLFAHGSWPTGVTFSHTPVAMRHLIRHPHDVAAAWPATPGAQLSGYGLMWGLFIGQLMVLFVLVVFVIGTVARWRAGRALQRRKASAGRPAPGRRAPSTAQDRGRRTAQAADAPVDAEAVTATGPTAPGAPSADILTKPTGTLATPSATTAGTEAVPGSPAATPGAPPHVTGPLGSGPAGSGTAAGSAAAGLPLSAPPMPTPDVSGTPDGPHSPSGLLPPTAPTAFPSTPSPSNTLPVVLGAPSVRRPAAVQALADAEGPALVVTSDPDVWAETKDARAKLGPVLLYDPAHRCDTPARLHWSPSAGCTDRAVAAERARALLAPVRPTAKIDTAVADTAETLLRCFLHAAAVDGRQFRQVHRWAQGMQVQDAVRTLRSHPKAASGAAGELEAALTAHPERRDIAQELTARALSALSSVHIRDACTPNRTDTATLDSFLAEGGTLYLVGEALEDPKPHPGAMPLLTALASSVVERGRRMAERSSSGRLDPPLSLVLEDVAAVAPFPQLPELLATGVDRGMPTLVLLRSREQARSRWPDATLPF